jgi:hypothetical protein
MGRKYVMPLLCLEKVQMEKNSAGSEALARKVVH